jgi:hypothetical protein
MPDFYVPSEADWNDDKDGIQEQYRQLALDNNPGHHIASETVTCPVSGVDDPNVALVHMEMEPDAS